MLALRALLTYPKSIAGDCGILSLSSSPCCLLLPFVPSQIGPEASKYMWAHVCVCVWGGAEGQNPSRKSPSELEAKENQLKIGESGKQTQWLIWEALLALQLLTIGDHQGASPGDPSRPKYRELSFTQLVSTLPDVGVPLGSDQGIRMSHKKVSRFYPALCKGRAQMSQQSRTAAVHGFTIP